MTPWFQAHNVMHHFGGLSAISEFNLELRSGELVGLIGPNGAGKTTIFNLITGVYRAAEGSILFQGRELVGLSPWVISGLGIARTFQNIRIFKQLSVLTMYVSHIMHVRATAWPKHCSTSAGTVGRSGA